MSEKILSFIFTKGRSIRIGDEDSAKEFLYTYNFFKEEYKQTNLFEYLENNNSSKFIEFIDKILRKITGLPFYLEQRPTTSQKNILSKSDYIVYTSHRHGLSSLPYFLFKKKNRNLSVIVMGLIKESYGHKFKNYIAFLILSTLFRVYDNFIFLSKGEHMKASLKFKKYSYKFKFLPFSIDTDFWKKNNYSKINNLILFIGNDGNREYEKVVELVNEMNDYSFLLITSKIKKQDLKNQNYKLIEGDWSKNNYSDRDIREFYEQAKLVILPLKESLQPSGQSVALQAMSMEVPVMITQTEGFWDYSKFFHNENIFFVKNNETKNWKYSINKVLNDDELLKKVSNNGYITVQDNYKLDKFYISLKKILKIT